MKRSAYSLDWVSIDINLMQKRERTGGGIGLPIALIAVAMGASGVFGWLWYDSAGKLEAVRSELRQTAAASAAVEAKLGQTGADSRLKELLGLPAALEGEKMPVTRLLDKLDGLLPAYANVVRFELDDRGLLRLTINFATTESIIGFSQAVRDSADFSLAGMGAIVNAADEAPSVGGTAASQPAENAGQPPASAAAKGKEAKGPAGQEAPGTAARQNGGATSGWADGLTGGDAAAAGQAGESPAVQKEQVAGKTARLPVYQTTFELRLRVGAGVGGKEGGEGNG